MSTFSVIYVDMKCVTPRVGRTYIRTDRVTKCCSFKSCSMQLKMENFLTWGCLVAIIVFQNKLFHFLNSYQIWSINSAIWGVKVSPFNKYFWSFEHLSLNILPDQGIQIFPVERSREKLSGTVEQYCHPQSRWDKCECDPLRYGQTSSKLSSHWSSSVVKRICSRYWNLPLRL